jgi:hypothetical protein
MGSMHESGAPERRRFAHVVVMAGASCSGKTTLTARLLKGELPALAGALDLAPQAPYHVLHGRDWEGVEAAAEEHVLVQYDLTAETPFASEGAVSERALDLLNHARHLTLLTVWERPDELKRRLETRFEERGGLAFTLVQTLAKRRVGPAWRSLQRFRQRRRLFGQPDDLWALYQRWFASCARMQTTAHWVVRSTNPDEVRKAEPVPHAPFWRS